MSFSNQGGLRFQEWKVQMGLPQGSLLALQESFQATESTNSRRVLSGLRLQPQIPIRLLAVQRHKIAGGNPQRPTPHLCCEGHDVFDGDLGSCGLSLFGAAQSSLTAVAPWAIKRLGISAVQKQLLSISPATMDRRLKTKNRQLKKRLYGRTKPGTLLKHHIPIKTDFWDVNTQALPKPIWSLTPATCCGRVHSFAQGHRHSLHLGGKSCGHPQRGAQCHARN